MPESVRYFLTVVALPSRETNYLSARTDSRVVCPNSVHIADESTCSETWPVYIDRMTFVVKGHEHQPDISACDVLMKTLSLGISLGVIKGG